MRLRLTERAHRDLAHIVEYITAENPPAARQVGVRFERAFDLLRSAPMIGREGSRPGVREFPVSGLPFLIIYRISTDTVEVLTIFHTSRDPERKGV